MAIILASSSPFRKNLLKKICPVFESIAPDIDERAYKIDAPKKLAETLAIEKAKAISNTKALGPVSEISPEQDAKQTDSDGDLIIGSDQVAWFKDQALHKPGNRSNNIEQLRSCSGAWVHFHTGLCLINTKTQSIQSCVETFSVKFRTLSNDEIEHYVDAEQAYQCAGGFKSEGLGICLFEELRGEDPNTLVGLPLIRLRELLSNEGYNPLKNYQQTRNSSLTTEARTPQSPSS